MSKGHNSSIFVHNGMEGIAWKKWELQFKEMAGDGGHLPDWSNFNGFLSHMQKVFHNGNDFVSESRLDQPKS